MAKTHATRGNNAQFTYDFGIAIAQSTIQKITKLTGASLSLAGAYYAVQKTAEKYVNTLRSNTLFFGGILNTMKLIEDSQNRLLKGQSRFDYDDQINGLNRLMQVGVDVRENFEWIDKSAHAMGMSFTDFANAIAQGIQGSMGGLVQMGLLTERATRMFDKYEGNTIMRQQAILNFVKQHKGLQNAINNDFVTMRDQMKRLKASWQVFLQSIVGKPSDPSSLYGQATSAMKMISDGFANFAENFRRYGYIIGQVTGWIIRQVGKLVTWLGRKVGGALSHIWKVTDAYQEQARSMIVWLEFWKVRIMDFLHKYEKEIKVIFWTLVGFKALKGLFIVSDKAIGSVIRLGNAWNHSRKLQKRYLATMGPAVGNKFTRWLQSLAAYMPKWFRRVWVSVGRLLGYFWESAGLILKRFFKLGLSLLKKAGWIGVIITAVTLLWKYCEKFREFVYALWDVLKELARFIYNGIMWLYVQIRVGIKKLTGWFKDSALPWLKNFFGAIGGWISDMWSKFMDTRVGQWVNKWIVEPLKSVFNWIAKLWNKLIEGLSHVANWFKRKNKDIIADTEALAAENGIKVPMWHEKDEDTTPTPTPSPSGYANPVVNPIIETPSPQNFGGNETTQVSVNKGAIQIIVQKGENIDEQKLAKMVVQQINDMQRQGKVRGGTF